MSLSRWAVGGFVAAVLVAVPACGGLGGLLPLRPRSTPPAVEPSADATTTVASPVKRKDEFSELAPGARLPFHPEATRAISTSVEPPVTLPPPVAIAPPPKPDALPPLDTDPPLVKAFREFLDGRPDGGVEQLKALGKPNQELMLQLIPAVVRASQVDPATADAKELAVLARQFESAAATLQKRAGLNLQKAVLCLSVKEFGVYGPVPEGVALRPGTVYYLYAEVGNVPCEPASLRGAAGYQVRVDCSMQVTDEAGHAMEIVDGRTQQPTKQLQMAKSEFFRSPVHDFFISSYVFTPTKPGLYTLSFEVRDPATGKAVSKPVPFRVQ